MRADERLQKSKWTGRLFQADFSRWKNDLATKRYCFSGADANATLPLTVVAVPLPRPSFAYRNAVTPVRAPVVIVDPAAKSRTTSAAIQAPIDSPPPERAWRPDDLDSIKAPFRIDRRPFAS